jgi:hypothetical protein
MIQMIFTKGTYMSATVIAPAVLDAALRRGFSDAGTRLKPSALMSDIIISLSALGITATLQDGILCLQQGASAPMNTALALKSFSQKPEHLGYFVQEGAHPSEWSQAKKIQFLADHPEDGDRLYAQLLHAPKLAPALRTLDANMDRESYIHGLTSAEKRQFINEFGIAGVEKVMRGRK